MGRKRQATAEIPPPRLSGFAPAIASLLGLGLPAKRLAELFGTNANYIQSWLIGADSVDLAASSLQIK